MEPTEAKNYLPRLRKAMQLQRESKFEPAEAIYQEILVEKTDHPDAIHLLGLIRSEQDRTDEAVELIEKAIELTPNASPFHHNIAGIYRRMGRLEDAEREFRRAIELKPDYGEAYQGLAEMVTFDETDPLLGQTLQQIKNPNIPDNVKSYFHFAAGKIYDDIGRYDNAFAHLKQGNKLANKEWNSAEFRQQVKDTIYVFPPSMVRDLKGTGYSSEQPVFIVGMPRSGTTLVEQILSSHSQVFGAGELNDMKFVALSAMQGSDIRQKYPNCVPGIRPSLYERLGKEYIDRITPLLDGVDYKRVVDKHPLNFQFVGLIMQMYPNARVIHTIRHPLDTCLSCFFQNFTKGQHYSFDLVKLAHFYNDYRRVMEHWESIYPDRILRVEYEDTIADQEAQTRRLLDFCGLDFEEACLSFHKTKREVKTASFLQVRKPLYNSSTNRWKNYSRHLKPAADILGIPVEEPVTLLGNSRIIRA